MYRLREDGGLQWRTLGGEIGRRLSPGDLTLQMKSGARVGIASAMYGSPGALQVELPRLGCARRMSTSSVFSSGSSHSARASRTWNTAVFSVVASVECTKALDRSSGCQETWEIRDQAGVMLLDWALGERGEIRLRLPFAEPHSLIPRLSADGQAICARPLRCALECCGIWRYG